MMNLISTRDSDRKQVVYEYALLSGLSTDGGLYTAERYPQISLEQIAGLRELPYWDIAASIKTLFTGKNHAQLFKTAYNSELFPHTQHGVVTPLQKIDSSIFLQNLSLGPTAAFKDMAMRPLALEIEDLLQKNNQTLRIVAATSGDTGSAAEAAFLDSKSVKLFMLSPKFGMSRFQQAQMAVFSNDHIHNISIEGTFDDCQRLVKELKAAKGFADIGAVNSMNWGRITSQIPYYFAGYVQAVKRIGEEVDFVVPSGNFGNVLSGYIAKRMGLPIRRLIVATNENNILDELIQTGVYRYRPSTVTNSPSMDISKASNLERLIFDLVDQDAIKTKDFFDTFATAGSVGMESIGLPKDIFKMSGFESVNSSANDRIDIIKRIYKESHYICDPHTAAGIYAAAYAQQDSVKMIVLETALAVKFEDTIHESLGFVANREERFTDLETVLKKDAFTVLRNDIGELKSYIKTHS